MAPLSSVFQGNPSRALALERQLTRDKFFKGDERISNQRLDNRLIQQNLEDKFRRENLRGGTGVAGLTQKVDPLGQDFAEYRRQVAKKYGPTLSDIGGDIRAGLGNIFQGIAQKGTPIIQLFKGIGEKFKGGVEQLWDQVRGETPPQVGTAFPQPSSDAKNLFSSIDTGIAASDPNNLLVQIAMANQDKFENTPTFQEQLVNATAQNLAVPDPRKIAEAIGDYYNAAAQGVDINTPIGNVNLNPLSNRVFLDGGIGPINYGGSINPDTLNYDAGIKTVLPFNIGLSAGIQSDDIPGVSFGKNLGPIDTNLSFSRQGGSLGFNTTVDPLKSIFPSSAIGTPINLGASIDSSGRVTPNVGFALPFNKGGSVNKNSGLGFMLK